MAVKIIALGGSLAEHSTSLAAVRIALEGAAQAGATTELYDVRQLDLPMLTYRTHRPCPTPLGVLRVGLRVRRDAVE